MSEIKFHQTVMGRQFFDGTMPKIARNLERIAVQLEKQSESEQKYGLVEDPVKKALVAQRWDKLKKELNEASENNDVLTFKNNMIAIQTVLNIMEGIEREEED